MTTSPSRRVRPLALAVVAAGVALALVGAAAAASAPLHAPALATTAASSTATPNTATPNTATALDGPPTATATPADGRLRGDGFAAVVVGVATGSVTATARAGPGQALWQFGLTATTTAPAVGGAPVNLTAALSVGASTVPVALPAPGPTGGSVGPVWFQASLPAVGLGGDAVLSLAAAGSTQSFSLTHMARVGPAPEVSYRDATSPIVATKPAGAIDIPESFEDNTFTRHQSTYPIHVGLDAVSAGFYAPGTPNHPAGGPAMAWLWVTLNSDGSAGSISPYAQPYLVIRQPFPATAITLSLPGGASQNPTVVPGGGGDKGRTTNFNANPTAGFPDTYLFSIPANLSTATLTVVPGPTSAFLSSSPDAPAGIATPTPAGANAAFTISLPPAALVAPPPGASQTPGVLGAQSSLGNSSQVAGTGARPSQHVAVVSNSAGRFLVRSILVAIAVLVLLVATVIAGGVAVRRRHATAAGPPLGPLPTWAPPEPPHPPPPPSSQPGPAVASAPRPPTPAPPEPVWAPAASPAWPSPASRVTESTPADPGPYVRSAAHSAAIPDTEPASSPVVAAPSAGVFQPQPSRPDLLSSFPPPTLPTPAIRVLGAVRLEGWANPPNAANLVELAVYLAVRAGPISTDTLRTRLSPRLDTDLGKETIRVYCSRLRNHLDASTELINVRNGYELRGITTDVGLFTVLAATAATAANAGDACEQIESIGTALALITGAPFADTDYRWMLTDNVVATITTQIRSATLRLCELSAGTNPELERWACHQALLANPADQTLAASALSAAAATGSPGALADEWATTLSRLGSLGADIDPTLHAHHRRLWAEEG